MQTAADQPKFGALLREFRLAAHLSQEALAERATMSAYGISALERGVNKAPQRETLALLVDALQLGPNQRKAIENAAARPARARAPSELTAKKQNLPRSATRLFGRAADLAEVKNLIARCEIVTLTGAGGVGKTRLAVETGYAVSGEFVSGVWFVDLAAIRDADGVVAAIADVVDAREHRHRKLLDAVVDGLARKKALLIFDNCEQIAAPVATAVAKITAGCPDVRILATSRQPLEVPGERIYRVASLSSDASIALFLEAAKRADESFDFDASDVQTVERICCRLDGIALAIELAAARVKLLSLSQIEELLRERFSLLTGGGHVARHKTMRALVDWSYDLLSPAERMLFERLAVFPSEFSLEAAVVVCGGNGIAESDILDVLGSLVDKSLLTSARAGKTRRFRLLETMRAYALEKLGAQIESRSRKHAEYYVKFVEAIDASIQERAETLETEYDNLRRALEWTIDDGGDPVLGMRLLVEIREFLLLRGFGADSVRRAEQALNSEKPLPLHLQALAWETVAFMRGDLLLTSQSLDAACRALALYQELGDSAGLSRALRAAGIAHLHLGNFAAAEEQLQRSLALTQTHGNRRDLIRTLGSIAVNYEMTGRFEEARKTSLEVLEMARRDGHERIIAVTLGNLAESEFALGEVESAAARSQELLASKIARKNVRLRAIAKANLAAYLTALDRYDAASAMARAAIFDAQDTGDTRIVSCAMGHLATIASRTDPSTAARLLGYVESSFVEGYRREYTERFTHGLLLVRLRQTLSESEIVALEKQGAELSEGQAVRIATQVSRLARAAS